MRLLALLVLVTAFVSEAAAQDVPFTEGTVWDVTFVQVNEGRLYDYMVDLREGWKRIYDAAKEEGHIISYKILMADRAHPADWDLLILVEYPNWAAFDGIRERFDRISETVFGSLEQESRASIERGSLRTILGAKVAQELTLR
jgi:hypothetical protein